MHLSDAQIARLVRAELTAEEQRAVRAHLDWCDGCDCRRAALALEDERIAEALGALRYGVPPSSVGAVIARAERRAARSGRGARRRNAVLGLGALLVATAAAAMPGSPLRRWVNDIVSSPNASPPRARPDQAPPASTAMDGRAVALDPSRPIEVAFEATQGSGEISIQVSDAPELRVWAADSSAGFEVHSGGVRVQNEQARASYLIVVPGRTPRLRVMVAGRTVFLREGGRILVAPPPSAPTDRVLYVVPLRPPSTR